MKELDDPNGRNERDFMKENVIKVQMKVLIEQMTLSSKTDQLLINFSFDGKMKTYLLKLPFEARIVFMFLLRARMFPTKENFPNRWSASRMCIYCCQRDTDEHLFGCCGYQDIICQENVTFELFFKVDCDMERLSMGANTSFKMHSRLLSTQEDKELNILD